MKSRTEVLKKVIEENSKKIDEKDFCLAEVYSGELRGIEYAKEQVKKVIKNRFDDLRKHHFGDDYNSDHPDMLIHKSDILAFKEELLKEVEEI